MGVVFEVGDKRFPMTEREATITAEKLRLKATQGAEAEGGQGALALADAIQDALVGTRERPIPLAGAAAEAMFYALNVSIAPSGQLDDPVSRLHHAVREIHYRDLSASS
jgi:hypothetical protein